MSCKVVVMFVCLFFNLGFFVLFLLLGFKLGGGYLSGLFGLPAFSITILFIVVNMLYFVSFWFWCLYWYGNREWYRNDIDIHVQKSVLGFKKKTQKPSSKPWTPPGALKRALESRPHAVRWFACSINPRSKPWTPPGAFKQALESQTHVVRCSACFAQSASKGTDLSQTPWRISGYGTGLLTIVIAFLCINANLVSISNYKFKNVKLTNHRSCGWRPLPQGFPRSQLLMISKRRSSWHGRTSGTSTNHRHDHNQVLLRWKLQIMMKCPSIIPMWNVHIFP